MRTPTNSQQKIPVGLGAEPGQTTPAGLSGGLPLQVSIPIALPDVSRIEALILQAAREVAQDRLGWLRLQEAAEYLRIAQRTWERKRAELGIPVAELDGIKLVSRKDLDALLLAHSSKGSVLVQWPSHMPLPDGAKVIKWHRKEAEEDGTILPERASAAA